MNGIFIVRIIELTFGSAKDKLDIASAIRL